MKRRINWKKIHELRPDLQEAIRNVLRREATEITHHNGPSWTVDPKDKSEGLFTQAPGSIDALPGPSLLTRYIREASFDSVLLVVGGWLFWELKPEQRAALAERLGIRRDMLTWWRNEVVTNPVAAEEALRSVGRTVPQAR